VVQVVFDKPGSFYKGNIHGHSRNSDGLLSPAEYVQAYKDRGYDFCAITDHFIGRYHFPVTDTAAFRSRDFTTLTGVEMHARGLQNGIIWDILALGVPFDLQAPSPEDTGADLARRAQETGAFVAIPHPGWNGVTHADALTLVDHIDAVEIHNEGHTLDSDRGSGWFLLDSLSTAGYRLSGFAADDAHFKADRFDRFGGWIHVKAEALEPEALLAAMKRGDYYASTGAEIHTVIVTSHEVVVECSPAVGVMLGGAGTARSYKRGDDLTRVAFPRTLFDNAWFRVIVVQADGRKAWTSPIWLID
jgi:hypothetical protein